jgi:anaerobic selenocysteine-containing dehydrogenase
MKQLSRRDFLKAGGITLLSTAGVAAFSKVNQTVNAAPIIHMDHNHGDAMAMPIGEVDHQFPPSQMVARYVSMKF